MKLLFSTVVGTTATAILFVLSLSNVVRVVQADVDPTISSTTNGVGLKIFGKALDDKYSDDTTLKGRCKSQTLRSECKMEVGCGWKMSKARCTISRSQRKCNKSRKTRKNPIKCRNKGCVWKKDPQNLTGPGHCESFWKYYTVIDKEEEDIDDVDSEFSNAATDNWSAVAGAATADAATADAAAAAGETTIRVPIPVVNSDRQFMESLIGLDVVDARKKIYKEFIKVDPTTEEQRRFNIYVCDPKSQLEEGTARPNCTDKAHRNNRIRLSVDTNNVVLLDPGIG